MSHRVTDRTALDNVRTQVAKLEAYLHSASIESHLRHLVKLRVSQINGCAYCMSMHTRDLLKEGERQDRIAVLPAWRETSWFSARERAALAWAESMTTLAGGEVPDDVFAQARAELSEEELADLSLCVVTINAWNRLSVAFHTQPDRFGPVDAALEAAD